MSSMVLWQNMILLVLRAAYGSRKSQLSRCDTISQAQMVQTITLDLPIGLLFLGRNETSLYSLILSGAMSRILSYLRVVSSRQMKQGEPIAGQQSTVSETANVPPITSGSLYCRHKALTAASNLSPQSMQLYTKVDCRANYTTFSQLDNAFPWKISMTVLPAVWKGALRAAASTLGTPTSACEQRSCLFRLCMSTTSQSRRKSLPTPSRMRLRATADPKPPTPRISTACCYTFFWSQSSIRTCLSNGPPKYDVSSPSRSRICIQSLQSINSKSGYYNNHLFQQTPKAMAQQGLF